MSRESQDLFDACRDLVTAAGLLGPRPVTRVADFPACDDWCWLDLSDGLLAIDIESPAGGADEAGDFTDHWPQCELRVELDMRAGTAEIARDESGVSTRYASDAIELLDALTDALRARMAHAAAAMPLLDCGSQSSQGAAP